MTDTGPTTGLTVLSISASPSASSSTHALLTHVNRRITGAGHRVHTLQLRDLPAQALVHADLADPRIVEALAAVAAADALVVATPVYQGSYSGLLKIFLDLLPQRALRGKAVLPLATGGSPAHVLAVDYALRPLLSALGAAHVGQGWFVPSGHVRSYPDGGLLLDPASAGPVAQVTDEFLAHLAGRADGPEPVVAPRAPVRVDPRAGAADLEVLRVTADDPRARPLLTDLVVEYGTRYGRPSANTQLTEVPISDFVPPHGTFLLLQENGEIVAGGALRRYDERTAEVKRVWTAARHRRRGLAVRVMAELEVAAASLGYDRVHLTTGPRQPEARALYLATGYTPRFDVDADPESIGPLAFGKELVPGAGLPEWRQLSWAEIEAAHRRHADPAREPVGATR
ncbi:NADPH-dependent FMN reductase [Nakamurella flavida]|uniref:NADPH-dependent FMN reductase n=1 Tax=Nakamurella flavida TaxID=363630 RepID=A0A938YPQ4_9ACTN|nr:NADPH-dependent FMN reductase [Nakamurella flavida]MBM9476710.1 NADPH-dependent FMN reductase [Nakamurella flavida]MDP9778852.1 SsuE family FMN reductase [Nakamurella flavida]